MTTFGRTLPPWFGRQTAAPIDPSIMGMLPRAQGGPGPGMQAQQDPQFTAGAQITPAADMPQPQGPQGPTRQDVMNRRGVSDALSAGQLPLESVSNGWGAAAYAMEKMLGAWAEKDAKTSEDDQKSKDRKALADALNSADPMTALGKLDIPEVQDMMVQAKIGQLTKAPAEKWQDIDQNGDGQPDAQRNSVSGEFKPIDRPLSVEDRIRVSSAGAARTNITMPGENAFAKGVGEAQAGIFKDMAVAGANAVGDLSSINELASNLQKTPGGIAGGLQAYALSFGVPLGKGATEAQAANAIISRLVPTQRTPGSGQMSDRDVLLFKDSLPKLVNSKEGNALILQTMQAMAQFKQEQGKIAAAAMNGQITRQQATEALMNLPDPLAKFRAGLKGVKLPTQQRKVLQFNPATGQVE